MRRLPTLAGSDPATSPAQQAPKNIDFIWGVKIPVRDGVQLHATVYKPKEDTATPAIFTMTP